MFLEKNEYISSSIQLILIVVHKQAVLNIQMKSCQNIMLSDFL